jgi:hypothetical protein
MSSTEIALPVPVGQPDRVGQGTAVEMSRAVAEVHAAMYGARQFPRQEAKAIREMENSCRQVYMADKAFYRLPRGEETVSGPTVHLARELARCWGHIQHGIIEMLRDDEKRQSEMQAFAWDVQTGTRLAHTFIVPHRRDKKDRHTKKTTPHDLVSLQEIYENNANAGARRLRECIFGVLPPWFSERAKELCRETSAQGDGTPLSERIDLAVAWFKEMGISLDQLEHKVDLPRIRWTGHEVSLLAAIYRSIKNHEVTKEQEFPVDRVTVEEITGQPPASVATSTPLAAASPGPSAVPADIADATTNEPGGAPTGSADEDPASAAALTRIDTQLTACGVADRAEKLDTISKMIRRSLASSSELTGAEATDVIASLHRITSQDEPARALDHYLANLDQADTEES